MMFAALKTIPDLTLAENEPIARYTAARLGGPADALAIAHNTEALIQAAQWAQQAQIAWVVLGGGANVLVSDAGFRGLVIINHSKNFHLDSETGRVEADSGVTLTPLARRCMAQGLKGLEWAVSVPGTLGGAIVNNAGAHGGDMAHNLVQATLLDLNDLTTQIWPIDKMTYGYRYSALKGQRQRYLVLQGVLQLKPHHDPVELASIADGFVAHRKKTQPPGASLGSIFKNPPGDYAGRLIEASGLKGYQVGGVQVSPIHANFIVNLGNGTASDYYGLIQYVRQSVYEKTGVLLELEIERIGEGFAE
ncbi:MAG: UDP-N-acetylmuramate dehydrogenase [Chloroflexi bacterium]|nr:UDP-N-acetylmuramate dehydrogenase [Chloroflexota bacterium]